MTDRTLSLAAQAVLDAVCDNTEPDCDTQHLIAAALRAAADAVAPHDYYVDIAVNSDDDGGWVNGAETRNEEIREAILAIAAELEAQ
jgi:hypothetical protein